MTVHFSPAALGGRSATLTVSASPGGSQIINLHGTGVNILMVSPTTYAFPDQPVGTTSATTADFVLTNYGTTPLSSFTITASDTSDFPITADTCARLLTINNLSGQAPHYVQTHATTIMPGDTNPNNNTGFALVIFS